MKSSHFIALAVLAAAACKHPERLSADTDRSDAQMALKSAPSASASSSSSSATIVPLPAPTSRFAVIAEGSCAELDVEPIAHAAFIHYGHVVHAGDAQPFPLTIARVDASGAVTPDPKLTAGLPSAADENLPFLPLDLSYIRGSWPDDARLSLYGEGGERVGTIEQDYRWKSDHWQRYETSEPLAEKWPWVDGTTIERIFPNEPANPPKFRVSGGANAPVPVFRKPAHCENYWTSSDLIREDDAFVVANCHILDGDESEALHRPVDNLTDGIVLHWSKSEPKSAKAALPPVKDPKKFSLGNIVALPNHQALLVGSDNGHRYAARFDGTTWTREQLLLDCNGWVLEDAGVVWDTCDKKMERRSREGKWEVVALPAIDSVAWQKGRPTWTVTGHDVWRLDETDKWIKEPLPAPAFSSGASLLPTRIKESPDGETWLLAEYTEKRPEWTRAEPRRSLLRIGPAPTPMRCEGGLSEWPPPATDACKTPIALLSRLSKSAPKSYDFPQTRAAVKGHTEIEGAQFVEIELAGLRFLAAKVPSIAVGTGLIDLVAKGVKGTRPELVCADPKVTRTLAIDLTTGKMAASTPPK